jgi:phytoene desaturase
MLIWIRYLASQNRNVWRSARNEKSSWRACCFHTNSNIEKIIVENKIAIAIVVNGERIDSDLVLSGADYHHTETLLDKEHRAYSENIGTVVFSSVITFYVGFDKK